MQELFVEIVHIEVFKRNLGFEGCRSNVNGKIWVFWAETLEFSVFSEDEQHITLKLNKKGYEDCSWMSIVYAKSTCALRLPLWEYLRQCNSNINGPWSICGDFNVIFETEEKGVDLIRWRKVGILYLILKNGMIDAGFSAPRFTWCNATFYRHRI